MLILFFFVNEDSIIYDFKKDKNISNWYIVDDGVMGGLSKGNISLSKEGNALYTGFVTTENNGGFSSLRHAFDKRNIEDYTHILLHIKGDGKVYQFRIKEDKNQPYSYVKNFKTSGNWESISIPLTDFYPSYRGYNLNKPNFSGDYIEEVAFLISNKIKETFVLEIRSISLE